MSRRREPVHEIAPHHGRRHLYTACLVAVVGVGAMTVLAAPALADDPSTGTQQPLAAAGDLEPVAAEGQQGQQSIPVPDPGPPPSATLTPAPESQPAVSEPTILAQDPPATTEPSTTVPGTPPIAAEPSSDDGLSVTPMTFSPGQTIAVEARTFRPGTPVTMTLGPPSRLPLAYASGIADESGVVRHSLSVWHGVRPGEYPFFAIGETSEGQILTLSVRVTVVPSEAPAVPPSAAPAPAVSARSDSDGVSSIPRTGGAPVGLAGLGTALVAGGWLLTRVVSTRRPLG